jgi:hypothetical protein
VILDDGSPAHLAAPMRGVQNGGAELRVDRHAILCGCSALTFQDVTAVIKRHIIKFPEITHSSVEVLLNTWIVREFASDFVDRESFGVASEKLKNLPL